MKYKELTERITGCAFRVYNKMGSGLLEKAYKKNLMTEFAKQGIKAEKEKSIPVIYKNEIIGEFFADILVEDSIIIVFKSARRITEAHEIQILSYLKATGKPVGLILNLSDRTLETKRKINYQKLIGKKHSIRHSKKKKPAYIKA